MGATVLALAAIAIAPAQAQTAPEKAQLCLPCHGDDGLSRIPNAPNIAGQPEMYLVKTMEEYRSGKRQDEMMGVIAKELTDDDIAALAAWFASFELTVKVPGQ